MAEIKFEEEMKRLERILEKMNDTNVSLDESIKLYEEGNKIIINLQNALKDAENKVEKVIKGE